MVMLSVLIPTVVGREEQINKLIKKICGDTVYYNTIEDFKGIRFFYYYVQGGSDIEIILGKDNKEITIGEKRELLYKRAKGSHSWMPDDDDDYQDNAIELILEAIKSNPEIPCITFKERCMINGEYKSSNHSIRYSQWMDNQDGYSYVRCPFYKDVIRTDIAKSIPFPHIRYNEDEQWSMAIKHLLTDEIHIDEELYHYIYNETNHEERYGLDRN